jgi:3-oxoacyl-(acyl-carrier-protein) synthase
MYAISAAGIGLAAFWQAARDGRSHGSLISRFDCSRNSSQIAAEVEDFDPNEFGIDEQSTMHMDRVTQFAVAASRGAVRHANLDAEEFDRNRAGVCIGTAIGGVGFMEWMFRQVCMAGDGRKPATVCVQPESVDANLFSAYQAHSVSHEVALDQQFHGFCTTMSTGCTAGLDAVGLASDLVAEGIADVMITGGADAPITPIVVTAFDNIGCLSRRNDAPRRASRPFDRDRDGFLLAEGCGILVLESEQHALSRNARILGYVLGYSSLSNAYHMTGLPSDGATLARTLTRVLESAGVSTHEVDYINAHGSSTPQNDRNETAAFKTVFGDRARQIPISSTKSIIGHTLGAASALETVLCVEAMQHSIIPPTANYDNQDAECDLDYVPNHPRKGRIRTVLCNASGFSGIHSALVLSHPEYMAARIRG